MSIWKEGGDFAIVGCKMSVTVDRKRQKVCISNARVSMEARTLDPSGLG